MHLPPEPSAPPAAARWLPLFLILTVPLLLVVAGWRFSPPMVNPDSAMGFYVWEARAAGGAWNCYPEIDSADIRHEVNSFLTWWSPGQYELPGIIRKLGFSWGHVILLSTLAAVWIAAAGCWRLARSLGAQPGTAMWFAVVSSLQWHTLFSFGHFRGGDVVLGAATPWMILWAWRVRARPWWFVAGVPVLIAGGLYLKLSAVLLTGPLLLAAGLANAWELRRRPRVLAGWLLATALLALATGWLVQKGFFAHGPTPAGNATGGRELFSPLMFALISPWLAATGLGSLLGHLWWWAGRDVDEIWLHYGWAVLPVALAAWWWPGRWLIRPLGAERGGGMTVVVGASVVMIGMLFARGAAIGVDDRYLRPTATVLLLALALQLEHASASRRRFAALALGAICLFGTATAAQRSVGLARMSSRGREDITQQNLSAPNLAKLAALNAEGAPRSALIYVPIPMLRLELPRQRVLLTDDYTVRREHRWLGRVPILTLAVPDDMESDGRAARVRSQFASYRADEWHGEHLADWWFWTAREPSVSPTSP